MLYIYLQKLESLASKLCKKYPQEAESIKAKQKEADENWEKLEDLSDKRSVWAIGCIKNCLT